MNADSFLALSASETLSMATGGSRPSPQSRHHQERPSHKADLALKGNRQQGYRDPHRHPTQYPHVDHRGNNNHRSGINSRNNQSRSNYLTPMNASYSHQEYVSQGSHSGPPRPTYRQNQGHSPAAQRKYMTNTNGTQQPSSRHRHSSPNISLHNTYSHSTPHAMSRSPSYESTTLRNFGYDGPLGNQSITMASPRHEITISEIAPQAHVNHPRPATEQVKDDASVHSSQILPSSTVPGPSDTALPHQPIYGVPWMMMPMPVMLPPHHHSQVIKPERQEPLNMIMDPVNIVRPAFEESPTFDSGARVPKDRDVTVIPIEQGRDRLREQLEWYLSPRNLSTDVYLVSKMNNEHWVPITILAEFRKVKELTGSLQEVVDALRRSPAVTVDDTGTMVKPVTVDRPRTTLLLRELPEDTTEEEIGAVFTEAGCCAKSITKEVVGNMWFVEFETATDALAMHNYTRGRYIKGVPIAARIKSTTVLTGGEYKVTQVTPTAMGVTSVSLAAPSPISGWADSPSSPSFDQAAMAMSMPYRRFPANESPSIQEWGQETNKTPDVVQAYSASVYPAGAYSSGGYFQPVIMGPPAHSAVNDGYYYNEHHAWTAVGGYGMLSPDAHALPETLQFRFADSSGLPEAQQQKANSAMGLRRSKYSSDPWQVSHGKFNEQGPYKNGQRRRQNYDTTRDGQLFRQPRYSPHQPQNPQQNQILEHDHGLIRPRNYYPSQNSSSVKHDRSDRSSEAKSDSFSSRISGSTSSERKNKKTKPKKNKADRQPKEAPLNEDSKSTGGQSTSLSGSTSAPELRPTGPVKEPRASHQNQIGKITNKMLGVSMTDQPGVTRNKRRGSSTEAVKPAQPSPNLESDCFPPLPSHIMYRSDSTGDPLMQTNSTSQLNTTWTCMTKNDASNINGSTDAVDEGACNGANDVRQSLKESNHQVSPGSVDNKPNKTQLQQATNPVETVVDNSNTEVLEQRHVPRGGMAISSTDYSADEGTLTGLDTHKLATGVTNKFRGPFSYASALKTLQQPSQRGIGFEDDADLHTGVGTATTE